MYLKQIRHYKMNDIFMCDFHSLCIVLWGKSTNHSYIVCMVRFDFDFWCLMPLSAIFQLYHDDQF